MGENVGKRVKIHIMLQFKRGFFLIKWYTAGIWYQRNDLKCIKVFIVSVGNVKSMKKHFTMPGKLMKKKNIDINAYVDTNNFENKY